MTAVYLRRNWLGTGGGGEERTGCVLTTRAESLLNKDSSTVTAEDGTSFCEDSGDKMCDAVG